MGNDNSEYQRQLFQLLTDHVDTATRVGEFELGMNPEGLTFSLLMEDSWQQELAETVTV